MFDTQSEREKSFAWYERKLQEADDCYAMGVTCLAAWEEMSELYLSTHKAWCELMDAYEGKLA